LAVPLSGGVSGRLVDRPDLRGRVGVFADRVHAGRVLAEMLETEISPDAVVAAIPAGGVPVGATLASALGVGLEPLVVSKVTFPWTTEAGYGAVAFDGTICIDRSLVERVGLSEEQVQRDLAATVEKVRRRAARFGAEGLADRLRDREVVVVDDGLASGVTLRTALAAVRHARPRRLLVAVPSAHDVSADRVLSEVDTLVCANLRSGPSFAVADAYRRWTDVSEEEALAWIRRLRQEEKPEP